MTGTRLSRTMTRGAALGLTLLTMSLIAGASPSAQYGHNGQLRIVKDCGPDTYTGIAGSTYCEVTRSNIPELPPTTRIYYNEITDGPTAGPGFLDSTIFVYVNDGQWAVGRCTTRIDDKGPGLCTLSDGVGPLAGLGARIVVTKKSGGSGWLYAWNGTYSFVPLQER